MSKKTWAIILIIGLLLNLTIAWAAGELVITAPRGGELDLQQKIMKYHGSDSQLVEVRWKDAAPGTAPLEQKKQGNTARNASLPRVLKAVELTVNLNQNYLLANKKVSLYYDESTSVTCNTLEWDRGTALMKLFGQVTIEYKDWTIKGSRVESQLERGLFTVYGPVEAFNKQNTIRGGKLIFDRGSSKAVISDNALLIRGKNEMAAVMRIVHHFQKQ